ncbi:MAG: alcohol dehydrogenase catalytic domain-containing protein [Pseudomonadota bacterium]
MRAAVLRAYRKDLSIENVPDPICPADGVVLRVLACGICRSDWHGWVGEHPSVKPGHIGGHEYCGEVIEAGPAANFAVGDRVIAPFLLSCGSCQQCRTGESNTCTDQIVTGFSAQGAFAEYVAVPRDHNLVHLPPTLTPVLAAALGCRVTTAWHALTGRAALQPGEWLAIHGTGGIGLAALMLGRALGARVIVTDLVPEKLAHAKSLGAEFAIDAQNSDSGELIREVTGGGAQVSIEALGLPATQAASLACLGPLGRHVQVGMPVGPHAVQEVDLYQVYMKNLALFGTRGMPAHKYASLLNLVEGGHVDFSPIVAREVRLSDTGKELVAFNGPMPPGVAVITDFAA